MRRCDATLAVADHNVPTTDRSLGIEDPESRLQVETLSTNCEEFGVEVFDMLDPRQGIVHVIGPEQGFTLPGTTVVCCDSHTATHGAFGALAFGIGASESEHVLATQTLRASHPKSMRVTVDDPLPAGCTGKDLIANESVSVLVKASPPPPSNRYEPRPVSIPTCHTWPSLGYDHCLSRHKISAMDRGVAFVRRLCTENLTISGRSREFIGGRAL